MGDFFLLEGRQPVSTEIQQYSLEWNTTTVLAVWNNQIPLWWFLFGAWCCHWAFWSDVIMPQGASLAELPDHDLSPVHDCPCRLWRCWLALIHAEAWRRMVPSSFLCLFTAFASGTVGRGTAGAQAKKPGVVLFLGMKSQKLVFCGPWPSPALLASVGSHSASLWPHALSNLFSYTCLMELLRAGWALSPAVYALVWSVLLSLG